MNLDAIGQIAGISGVTGLAILGGLRSLWRKSAPWRARRTATPLDITRQEETGEPGHIWALVTDEVLEREDFVRALSEGNRGSSEPNLFRREVLRHWALFDAYPTTLKLTLLNPHAFPIYITAIEGAIVRVCEPLSGTCIVNPPQGEMGVRKLHIDLDHPQKAQSPDGTDYFAAYKLELPPSGQEFLELSATTDTAAYEWRVQMTLSIAGKDVVQLWPPTTQEPLRSSVAVQAYQREWVCSPLVSMCPDAQVAPYLHDGRLDRLQ